MPSSPLSHSLQGIDVHAHYFPATMPRWAERFPKAQNDFYWIRKNAVGACPCATMMCGSKEFRPLDDSKLWEPERYLDEQAARGIWAMALSPTPQNFYYEALPEHTLEIARYQNDQIADLQRRFPGRFFGLGTIPLQDSARACGEITRCIKELGLSGIEIATTCNGKDLSDPEFFSVFETTAALGACVFVHPWYFPQSNRFASNWGQWLLTMPEETTAAMFKLCCAELLKKLPTLRIGFAHGGGNFAWLLPRMEHGIKVRPDLFTSPTINFLEFAKSVFYDSHLCSSAQLQLLVETVGAERVMAGSDWPYVLGEKDLAKSITDTFRDSETTQKLLVETPRTFLGI
jgi:aminocarboxymuconate-semialdehyde decarboxylase